MHKIVLYAIYQVMPSRLRFYSYLVIVKIYEAECYQVFLMQYIPISLLTHSLTLFHLANLMVVHYHLIILLILKILPREVRLTDVMPFYRCPVESPAISPPADGVTTNSNTNKWMSTLSIRCNFSSYVSLHILLT